MVSSLLNLKTLFQGNVMRAIMRTPLEVPPEYRSATVLSGVEPPKPPKKNSIPKDDCATLSEQVVKLIDAADGNPKWTKEYYLQKGGELSPFYYGKNTSNPKVMKVINDVVNSYRFLYHEDANCGNYLIPALLKNGKMDSGKLLAASKAFYETVLQHSTQGKRADYARDLAAALSARVKQNQAFLEKEHLARMLQAFSRKQIEPLKDYADVYESVVSGKISHGDFSRLVEGATAAELKKLREATGVDYEELAQLVRKGVAVSELFEVAKEHKPSAGGLPFSSYALVRRSLPDLMHASLPDFAVHSDNPKVVETALNQAQGDGVEAYRTLYEQSKMKLAEFVDLRSRLPSFDLLKTLVKTGVRLNPEEERLFLNLPPREQEKVAGIIEPLRQYARVTSDSTAFLNGLTAEKQYGVPRGLVLDLLKKKIAHNDPRWYQLHYAVQQKIQGADHDRVRELVEGGANKKEITSAYLIHDRLKQFGGDALLSIVLSRALPPNAARRFVRSPVSLLFERQVDDRVQDVVEKMFGEDDLEGKGLKVIGSFNNLTNLLEHLAQKPAPNSRGRLVSSAEREKTLVSEAGKHTLLSRVVWTNNLTTFLQENLPAEFKGEASNAARIISVLYRMKCVSDSKYTALTTLRRRTGLQADEFKSSEKALRQAGLLQNSRHEKDSKPMVFLNLKVSYGRKSFAAILSGK